MHVHAPSHPGIHLDEAGRFGALDINRFAVLQNGQVRGQMHTMHQRVEHRPRQFPEIQSLQHPMAKVQHLQPHAVLATFRLAAQVSAPLQTMKDVARRALRYAQFAADFRIGQPVGAFSNGLKNSQCPFDGRGGTLFLGRHLNSIIAAPGLKGVKSGEKSFIFCSILCTVD